MPRYRSKTSYVQAVQWNHLGDHHLVQPDGDYHGVLVTKSGPVPVNRGDWIVSTDQGEFVDVCPDQTFRNLYERA